MELIKANAQGLRNFAHHRARIFPSESWS
ncbi:MAG: hypothetical protein WCH44_07620 [Betaproteobacteria bacterium]